MFPLNFEKLDNIPIHIFPLLRKRTYIYIIQFLNLVRKCGPNGIYKYLSIYSHWFKYINIWTTTSLSIPFKTKNNSNEQKPQPSKTALKIQEIDLESHNHNETRYFHKRHNNWPDLSQSIRVWPLLTVLRTTLSNNHFNIINNQKIPVLIFDCFCQFLFSFLCFLFVCQVFNPYF